MNDFYNISETDSDIANGSHLMTSFSAIVVILD